MLSEQGYNINVELPRTRLLAPNRLLPFLLNT